MKRILILAFLCLTLLTACQAPQESHMDQSRLQADTKFLCQQFGSRVTGTQEEQDAVRWLEEQLTEMGYSREDGTLYTQPVVGLKEVPSENLIVRTAPKEEGDILCVVAHYDSVSTTPGARDNAASVAILLELARNLASEPVGENTEIRLIFLGAEETGYHGSRCYLEGLTQEELDRHKAAFNMDISAATKGEGQLVCCTLGARTEEGYQEGNFMEPIENMVSRTIAQAAKQYRVTPVTVHGGESDHVRFHQFGVDSANVCWRRVVEYLPRVFPEYHSPGDVPETIDYSTAALVGNCVYQALCDLAR